jgi:AcrR family transcriptional regulator
MTDLDDADERVLTRAGLNRKAELLKAAQALFAERGFTKTRMVDIAEAVGVTKGNLYWYFANKEALAQEIAVDARDRLRAAQRDATRGVTGPLEIVYAGAIIAVRFSIHDSPLWSSVYGVGGGEMRATLAESSLVHARDASRSFRAGQKLGVVRANEDPVSLGHVAEGIVNQMVQATLRGHLKEPQALQLAARSVIFMAAASHEIAMGAIGNAEAEG